MTHYSFFLFDFDGLLVDTEPLHYAAYMEMSRRRGFPLPWDFERFCKEAHSKNSGFFDGLEKEHPTLFSSGLSKEILYEEKKKLYVELLKSSPLSLVEGIEAVLKDLEQKGSKRAVVTNSPRVQIELIWSKIPLLKTIPLWITREDYAQPKPAPDGYLEAMKRLHVQGEKGVGFEDSARGILSLLRAGVDAVLVCPPSYAGIAECQQLGASHIERLSVEYFTSARNKP